MRFNFGIIGCGSVAKDHATVIKKLGHQVILGTTKKKNSKNWKLFKKICPETKYVNKINEILLSNKVQYIVSCLPIDLHKKYCKKLLATNKPVLIEKPLHDNFLQLKKIMSRVNNTINNKIIGYNRRHYKTVDILRRRIKKGGLKNVEITISENYQNLVKKYGVKILKNALHVGSSSHIIDLAIFLFGPLDLYKKWSYKKKQFISYSAVLSTKNNIPIFLNINTSDPSLVGFKVRFDDETLWVLSPIEKLKVYKGYEILERTKKVNVRKYSPKVILNYSEDTSFRPGFYNQMKSFIHRNYKLSPKPKENLNLLKLINNLNKKI
tara:strand:+ start:6296 stop:7264 length:969 start_codon:yes stop_codon:yes gene_type:complete